MEIEPTTEDRERALARLENPRDSFIETVAKQEARRRLAAEKRDEQHSWLRRIALGLFGR